MSMLEDPQVTTGATRLWPDLDDDRRADRTARAAWTVLAEPGDGTAGALVAALGPAGALRLAERSHARGQAAFLAAGIEDHAIAAALARWRPRGHPQRIADCLAAAAKAGLELVTPEDPAWPVGVRDLGVHAPLALWARGDVAVLRGEGQRAAEPVGRDRAVPIGRERAVPIGRERAVPIGRERAVPIGRERAVAIVGARAASSYGEWVAGELSAGAANAGITVVSGAAYGIDAAAHRAALACGGATVAFVAGGADRAYPAGHAHLLAEIARCGAVVSEVAPGTTPTKWRFLQRNRLIAACTDATIVVEAGARSGSLNTAGHAAAIGRPIGAVPGPVTSASSAGCHRLLREFDATCVTDILEVRELLGDCAEGASRRAPLDTLTSTQTRVRDALGRRGSTAEQIAASSGLPRDEVPAALSVLELLGLARSTEAGWALAAR